MLSLHDALPSWRGHGESGWSADGDYRLDRFVDDLAAVLSDLPAPAFLVGASLGGLASLIAAGEGRGPVAGLVFVDVAPRIDIEGAQRIRSDVHTSKPQSLMRISYDVLAFKKKKNQHYNTP